MLPTTSKLTNAERLRIARRRAGATQEQWARMHGMSLRAYKAAESGAKNAPSIRAPALDKLRPNEACRVLRMRKGLTLGDVADKLGVTKWWLCLMEQGKAPVATLLKFWTRRTR
jgi:DNA-binding XRE family transcriptional regulator